MPGSTQTIEYTNHAHYHSSIEKLGKLPPLTSCNTIQALANDLKQAAQGQAFILQAGDCAENVLDATLAVTQRKAQHLQTMADYLRQRINKRVIPIGRIAGQYAKPRSKAFEEYSGKQILSYRGDMINHPHQISKRYADPNRMLTAYACSQRILTYLGNETRKLYTSHECLLLPYEKALTREDPAGRYYNLSTDFPWLGVRTHDSFEHIHYLSTIENPVAIKVGPLVENDLLIENIKTLNPNNQFGKITLIIRYGTAYIEKLLPLLIARIQQEQLNVIWCCDPMHGNTHHDNYGKKYRLLSEIINEFEIMSQLCKQANALLSGLHIESTYLDDIEECVTSTSELSKPRKYTSLIDPRLNHEQSFYFLEHMIWS